MSLIDNSACPKHWNQMEAVFYPVGYSKDYLVISEIKFISYWYLIFFKEMSKQLMLICTKIQNLNP